MQINYIYNIIIFVQKNWYQFVRWVFTMVKNYDRIFATIKSIFNKIIEFIGLLFLPVLKSL